MNRGTLSKLFASLTFIAMMSAATRGHAQTTDSIPPDTGTTIDTTIDMPSAETIKPAVVLCSDYTRSLYGDILAHIQETAPFQSGLHALVITAHDLVDTDTTYRLYNWRSLYPSCDPIPNLLMQPGPNTIFEFASNGMSAMFYDAVSGGFLTQEEFSSSIIYNFSEYSDIIYGATAAALSEAEGCLSLNACIPAIQTKSAIIVLKPSISSAIENAVVFSGLGPEYLKDIPGTPEDWACFTIGHEFGHAFRSHNEDNIYLCDTINMHAVEESWQHEGYADVDGSIFFSDLQRKGIVSPADIPTSVDHLRGIGTFFLQSNSIYARHFKDTNGHVTTLVFDPDSTSFESGINLDSLPNVSEIPLIINTYADALSGFIHVQAMKQKIQAGDTTSLIQDDIAAYTALPDTAGGLWSSAFHSFVACGLNARTYYENKEYFYTAMAYMEDKGIFDRLRAQIPARYHAAFDDLLHDFFSGCDAHGSDKLVNNQYVFDLYQQHLQELPDMFTWEVLENSKTHLYVPPAPQPPVNGN